MPESMTTPGRADNRNNASFRVAPSLASADVVEIQGDTVCVVAVQSGVVIGPVG